MKKRLNDRTMLAVWLCAVMLAVCLFALARYLAPVLQGFSPSEPDGAAFGMVLIDIADQDTADSYHVETYGVYVLAVQEKSPAEAAGVLSGDLLLSVNTVPVASTGELVTLQERLEPGEQVQLHFQRGSGGNAYAVTLAWNEVSEK